LDGILGADFGDVDVGARVYPDAVRVASELAGAFAVLVPLADYFTV
jgi:hypothetical protein